MVREFLLRVLGGVSIEFCNKVQNDLINGFQNQFKNVQENYQMALSAKIAEIETLKSQIQDYKEDRSFYQDKLFPKPELEDQTKKSRFEPIPISRIPWTRRRHELEKQDRTKAQEEAKKQADNTEAQIRAKNQRVEEKELHA